MATAVPGWESFDFNSGVLPSGVQTLMAAAGAGSFVAFAPTAGAEEDDWAPRAVTTVAAFWGDRGQRVILADVGLDHPRLHDVLDEENGEGVVDAVLYGASVRRITTPAAGGSFLFAPSGTYTADPEAVLRHGRWDALIRSFTRDGSILLAYVPVELPGFRALAARASAVVLLALRGEAAAGLAAGVGARVSAVLGPAVEEVEPAPAAEEEAGVAGWSRWGGIEPVAETVEEQEKAAGGVEAQIGARDDWGAPAPAEAAAAGQGEAPREEVPVPGAAPTFRVALAEPAAKAKAKAKEKARRPAERRGASPVTLVGLFLALGAAVWYYLIEDAPLPFLEGAAGAGEESAAVELPLLPQGRALPYSVAVGAYPTLEEARGRADSLQRAHTGVPALIAPVIAGGRTFYRVLVGALADSAAARALGERAAGGGDWILRDASLAFGLGELGDRGLAERRVRELADLSVPAYVVPVPYSGGRERYRIYAGGYESEAEAAAMRALLGANGIEVPLVPRNGRSSP